MKVLTKAPALLSGLAAALIAAIGGLSLAIPKPSDSIIMTTGGEKGLYYRFGSQLTKESSRWLNKEVRFVLIDCTSVRFLNKVSLRPGTAQSSVLTVV